MYLSLIFPSVLGGLVPSWVLSYDEVEAWEVVGDLGQEGEPSVPAYELEVEVVSQGDEDCLMEGYYLDYGLKM